MRDRRPQDWIIDLTGRHELETQVASALRANANLDLIANETHCFDRLDYTVATKRVPEAHIELKAKWQPYRGWQRHRRDVAEHDLFILDELALRRIVAAAPHGQLVIYDRPQGRWIVFGVVDLILAPKARVARKLSGRRPTTKGKILIDLNDGHETGTRLTATVDYLASAIDDTDRRWSRVEPWPNPHIGEAS